ncbi:MAG TPA: hypothetical protein VHD95_15570 [Rhizomicrobium sp.]|jgi:hypothetical protein|nr:hypothetical protein [Rhizomicrobium sp.]
MLRAVVLALGAIGFLAGLFALAVHAFPPAAIFGFWGALVVIGTIYERYRYKPLEAGRPGSGWVATSERFIDDETGKAVTVYLDPKTGERKYVTE